MDKLVTTAPEVHVALLRRLRGIVGNRHVLTDPRRTHQFRKGYRYGEGKVLAVVRPGSLLEQWRVFTAIVDAGLIVIVQAANTGLTGGSTPFGDDYDRAVVVINTLRINRIDLIQGGRQVLCLAGATLDQLEQKIRRLNREPHSIIGSTSIGASVVGGICNNSGGSLVRRGPAFTQLALFARVCEDGSVKLVNHLGIELGDVAEEILSRLDRCAYSEEDVDYPAGKLASDPDYQNLVRDIDSSLPARYNNDERLLYEASGSAGKLCVFAVRLDTFAKLGTSKVFYLGTNDHEEFTLIRRHILKRFETIPLSGEYLHRDAYNMAQVYGKDLYIFLSYFGSAWISTAFKFKSRFDAFVSRIRVGKNASDRLLQRITRLLPEHLPDRMNAFRDAYEHHLLLRIDAPGIEEARKYLSSVFPTSNGDFFECNDEEAAAAFRHRYAVGGAAVRYRAVHTRSVEDILALDIALPRNTLDWRETLPDGIDERIVARSIYGHFFCQVFHCDYAIKKGVDWLALEHRVVRHLEQRGIELPSEHNVGHLYAAKSVLAEFYRSLDPTNTLNPGIGQTSRRKNWA